MLPSATARVGELNDLKSSRAGCTVEVLPMRITCLLPCLLFSAWLTAQHGTPPQQPKHEAAPLVHAPHPFLPPAAALECLRAGLVLYAAASMKGQSPPPPSERPGGAGRYVAAVVCCADADLDLSGMFGLAQKDLLVIRVPGPFLSLEITALLEQAVLRERLSLCVVLSHADCACLSAEATQSPAGQALKSRIEAARALATERHLALPAAIAGNERDQLIWSSPPISAAIKEGRFRIVPATFFAPTKTVLMHLSRKEEMPIAPVK